MSGIPLGSLVVVVDNGIQCSGVLVVVRRNKGQSFYTVRLDVGGEYEYPEADVRLMRLR